MIKFLLKLLTFSFLIDGTTAFLRPMALPSTPKSFSRTTIEHLKAEIHESFPKEDIVSSTASSPKMKTTARIQTQRIVRRLNTREDFMGFHKFSAAAWAGSLLYITLIGLSNEFSEVPANLEIPTWIALVSSVAQSITGYDMAIKYRANDLAVQKGMINSSFQMLSVAMSCFYISPFAPDAFNDFRFGNGVIVATLVPCLIMGLDDVYNMRQTFKDRRLRRNEPTGNSRMVNTKYGAMIGDFSSYGLASMSGFVFAVLALSFATDPCHDRLWVLHQVLSSCPNFAEENFYAACLFNLSIGIGVFCITLRDKKLITKSTEQTWIASFILPALFLSWHSSPF
mmetsp:Transcript_29933/g.45353  ORF Transcript_29933/g.45353 Transcript_29933/m.45353 type:complete len:340 (+) Transcript_29933:358-1377(+)|eukprot:CAMPEP_0178934372 /NCGR_PEP_ID=MMETSP0786-20121207/23825_1 /TAXON_ID=186022 /ORGANISM="Thalassionema frauenfeldii, Strain CCMP 1798" /LENGTH=339 /DNA_ID=CAMNT_0020612145 /DNA_START=76 /DNA_END=1095 /DNA_ORIENTATION=-